MMKQRSLSVWLAVLLSFQSFGSSLAGDFPPCNVCGDGFTVGNILAEFNGTPCSEIKATGEDGDLDPAECVNVQSSSEIAEACSCTELTPEPTPAPSTSKPTESVIQLTGEVVVVLLNVTTPMSPPTVSEFETDMTLFMAEYFASTNNWPGSISGWTAELTHQELLTIAAPEDRRHQRSLRQDGPRKLQASAPRVPLETRTTITAFSSSSVGIDFDSLLRSTIVENQPEFIALQRASNASIVNRVYFQTVETLETFSPDEEVTTERVQLTPIQPAFTPTEEDDDNSPELDNRTIAGIAAAAGFVFILIAGVLCVICRNDDEKEEDLKQNSFGDSLQDRNTRSIGGGSSRSSNASRYRSQRLGNPMSSSTRIVSSDGRTVTVLSNSEPTFKPVGLPEQAPPEEEEDDAYTPVFHDEARMDEPEAELEDGEAAGDAVSYEEQSYVTDPSYQESSQPPQQQHDHESYQEESVQQDDGTTSTGPSAAAAAGAAAGAPRYTTREITAPPGKLGIVIETTLDGPVVHKINPSSPLDGVVNEGDLIVAIDDVDCRAMSASAITALMVRTSEKYRRMTIRTED